MLQVTLKTVTLALTALMITTAQAADHEVLDLLPWPWGSECPFPWTKIEGTWTVRKDDSQEKFTFEVTGTWENGTNVLEVRRYDGKGRLIGVGEGISPKGERVVRAVMTGFGPHAGKSYWAIVRTYSEKISNRKNSCARGKLVTVITLRPTDGSSEDVHLIVDKEAEGSCLKP